MKTGRNKLKVALESTYSQADLIALLGFHKVLEYVEWFWEKSIVPVSCEKEILGKGIKWLKRVLTFKDVVLLCIACEMSYLGMEDDTIKNFTTLPRLHEYLDDLPRNLNKVAHLCYATENPDDGRDLRSKDLDKYFTVVKKCDFGSPIRSLNLDYLTTYYILNVSGIVERTIDMIEV